MAKPTRVTIYRDASGRYRWRAQSGNNRVVGASEQSFLTHFYCKRRARKVWPQAEFVDKP
jgi:hypothetical protein